MNVGGEICKEEWIVKEIQSYNNQNIYYIRMKLSKKKLGKGFSVEKNFKEKIYTWFKKKWTRK